MLYIISPLYTIVHVVRWSALDRRLDGALGRHRTWSPFAFTFFFGITRCGAEQSLQQHNASRVSSPHWDSWNSEPCASICSSGRQRALEDRTPLYSRPAQAIIAALLCYGRDEQYRETQGAHNTSPSQYTERRNPMASECCLHVRD